MKVTIKGTKVIGQAAGRLRIYADEPYFNNAGDLIPQSGASEPIFDGAAAASGSDALLPDATIDSTTDSPDNPEATLTAVLTDSAGNIRHSVLSRFKVEPTPSFTTFEELKLRTKNLITVPSDEEGCILHARAAYSSLADAAAVPSLVNLSSSGAPIANADPDTRPAMKIENGVRMIHHASGAKHLAVSLTAPIDTARCTVFFSGRNQKDQTVYSYLVAMKDQVSGALVTDNASLTGEVAWLTNAKFGGGGKLYGSEFKVLAARVSKDASALGPGALVQVNGRPVFRTQNQKSEGIAVASANSSTLYLGVFAPGQTFNFIGDWTDVAVFDRPLSDAAFARQENYFNKVAGGPVEAAQRAIIFDGDSLTAGGLGDAVPNRPWPDTVLLAQAAPFKSFNFAVQGQTCAQMLADQATQVLPFYDSSIPSMLFFFAGSNDLAAASVVNQLKSDYQTYCVAARARGFKVIAFTLLPRVASSGTYETDRQTFNTWLRLQTFYDALCDVGADSTIGDAGDNTNETNYATDHIHLNSTGYGIVANTYALPKLAALLG